MRELIAVMCSAPALFLACGSTKRDFGRAAGTADTDTFVAGAGADSGAGGQAPGAGITGGTAGKGGDSPIAGAGANVDGKGGDASAPLCNGADIRTDPKNCGTCGHDCSGLANLAVNAQGITCEEGTCLIPDTACVAGKKHCSTKLDDVCEADVTTSSQCGACGNECNASQICSNGACADNCAAGATRCTSGQSVGCYTLSTSADHCGNCSTSCPTPPSNGTAACSGGSCKVQCSNGFHQCSASAQCEADSDLNHCGPTCKQCETNDPNAAPKCSSGACSYPCNTGYQYCGFCASKNDPANCGSCGNVCGSFKSCVGGICVDNLSPTIVSITPADGATKLTPATDTIVITFSEPMNKASTQAAFVASSGAPVFSWDATGSELTIDPKVPYPTANDPVAAAVPYKYTLSTGAKDLAGNSIATALNRQFSLLREITKLCPYSYGGSLGEGDSAPSQFSGTFVGAGDTSGNRSLRGFMSFDLSGLPNGIQTFESGTLGATIVQIDGSPFSVLGNYLIHSVAFSAINAAAYAAAIRIDLGTLVAASGPHATGEAIAKDVLSAVKSDYANRVALLNQTQYRVLFTTPIYSDGVAQQAWVYTGGGIPTLTVKYLFP